MQKPSEVHVLLSGGIIDSTALVAFCLSRDIAVRGVHFNYWDFETF
jgi:tRNA U34 2-thiouridine synthase MnmA/TrmU